LNCTPTTSRVRIWRGITSEGARTNKVEYHCIRPFFEPSSDAVAPVPSPCYCSVDAWMRVRWESSATFGFAVESQKDYHTKRSTEGLQTTTVLTTTSGSSLTWAPHQPDATSRKVTPIVMPSATTTSRILQEEGPQSTELVDTPSTTPTTTTTTLPPRE
jgi:hypothetical protein